jgi:CspA family cold shock protein
MFRISEVGFSKIAVLPTASTKLSVHSVCARFFGRSYKVRSRLWVTIEGAAADGTSATGSVKMASIHLAAAVILFPHATILVSKIGLAAVAAGLAMIAALAAVIDSAADGGRGPGGGAGGGGGFSRMPAQVVGTGKGTVKFFNSQKGFGFIQQETGGEDIFVHISAVERAGLEGLAEGQELEFNLVDRGGKVSAQDLQVVGDVIAVEQKTVAPQRELTGEKATGTVKFFNSMKGFGFLTRDDGQPDAFVHISAVERSGLQEINEGERFEFDLEVDRRGKHSAVNLVPVQD